MKRSENRPGDHLRDRQLHRLSAAREQKDLTPRVRRWGRTHSPSRICEPRAPHPAFSHSAKMH